MRSDSRANLHAEAMGPELLGNILHQLTAELIAQVDANSCRPSADRNVARRRDFDAGRRELALCGYGASEGRDCSK